MELCSRVIIRQIFDLQPRDNDGSHDPFAQVHLSPTPTSCIDSRIGARFGLRDVSITECGKALKYDDQSRLYCWVIAWAGRHGTVGVQVARLPAGLVASSWAGVARCFDD